MTKLILFVIVLFILLLLFIVVSNKVSKLKNRNHNENEAEKAKETSLEKVSKTPATDLINSSVNAEAKSARITEQQEDFRRRVRDKLKQ